MFSQDAVMIAAGFANSAVYPQPLVEQLIAEVECLLPLSRWSTQCTDCNRRDLATKYLVAHRLTVMKTTGVIGQSNSGVSGGLITGQVSSISASQGSQSLSFTPANDKVSGSGWLSEGQTNTYWWTQFLALMGTRRVAIGFTS